MNRIFNLFKFSKRKIIIGSVIFLSICFFISEFLNGLILLTISVFLSFLTSLLFYLATRRDVTIRFSYPIFILPFFYTLAFSLFYPLLPERLLTRFLITGIFTFGLYSLFLTQNIFAVSAVRTINLLRSARIVSFVLTIIVLFLLSNIIFSQRLPIFLASLIIFAVIFLLNYQSIWTYTLSRETNKDTVIMSFLISAAIAQLSLVLSIWPINAAIYAIFITGIFYAYSGLCHAWVEKRLFKNVLWEYIWVGFLAVLILIFFSKWGI